MLTIAVRFFGRRKKKGQRSTRKTVLVSPTLMSARRFSPRLNKDIHGIPTALQAHGKTVWGPLVMFCGILRSSEASYDAYQWSYMACACLASGQNKDARKYLERKPHGGSHDLGSSVSSHHDQGSSVSSLHLQSTGAGRGSSSRLRQNGPGFAVSSY